MEWTGERLESVFFVGFVFSDLEVALDSTAHEMADAAKKSSYPNAALRNLSGFQSPVLPLKIVFRCADEIEDLFDGPVDKFV